MTFIACKTDAPNCATDQLVFQALWVNDRSAIAYRYHFNDIVFARFNVHLDLCESHSESRGIIVVRRIVIDTHERFASEAIH